MNNKKGIVGSIFVFMFLLFIFALFSLLSITLWTNFDDTIQSMDNDTVSQDSKDKVHSLSFMVLWGDKLFTILMLVLLASFFISCVTLPVEKPIFIIVYLVMLTLFTVLAMFLSNTWTYLINNPNFVVAMQELTFTNYFINYYPIIIFFVGLGGGLLFFNRRSNDFGSNSGAIDNFE